MRTPFTRSADPGPRRAVAAGRRRRRPCLSLGDRGAGFAEYGAVILLVAGVAAVVFTTGIGDRVAGFINAALCDVSQSAIESADGCGADGSDGTDAASDTRSDTTTRSQPAADGTGQGPGGAPGSPPPDPPPGYPSPQDFADAEADIERIRGYLNEGICLWWCRDGEPQDVMADMTAGELNALLWTLSDGEIRELLDSDGARGIILDRVDLATLRHVRAIDPDNIEPDYDDIEYDIDNLAWGTVPDGRLWPEDGEISAEDVHQGALGDCWWVAGLAATAEQNPEVIRDMIRENPNGTYTVIFGNGQSVTVTPDLVLKEDGGVLFAKPQDDVLWPAILEKAYAQREGGFGDIENGRPGDAMQILTGSESEHHSPGDVDQRRIEDWLANGTAITIQTKDDEDDGPYEKETLIGDHSYVVTGFENGRVRLYNPWGYRHTTLSMEEFREHLETVETNSFG
ncbi:C2 family cysteine protease [Nocardiopsis sediminis]|uniref:C2 family cysteine protease n=1 Tax=Nocardiopsis sediminis TaxID=1778267 RepID=A0ABV8FGP2_9ACTN